MAERGLASERQRGVGHAAVARRGSRPDCRSTRPFLQSQSRCFIVARRCAMSLSGPRLSRRIQADLRRGRAVRTWLHRHPVRAGALGSPAATFAHRALRSTTNESVTMAQPGRAATIVSQALITARRRFAGHGVRSKCLAAPDSALSSLRLGRRSQAPIEGAFFPARRRESAING